MLFDGLFYVALFVFYIKFTPQRCSEEHLLSPSAKLVVPLLKHIQEGKKHHTGRGGGKEESEKQ